MIGNSGILNKNIEPIIIVNYILSELFNRAQIANVELMIVDNAWFDTVDCLAASLNVSWR